MTPPTTTPSTGNSTLAGVGSSPVAVGPIRRAGIPPIGTAAAGITAPPTRTYEDGVSSSGSSSGGHASGSIHQWCSTVGSWTEGNWIPGSGSGSGHWEYASGNDSTASDYNDYDSYYYGGYHDDFGGWYYPGGSYSRYSSQGMRGDDDYSLDLAASKNVSGIDSSVLSIFDGLKAEWSLVNGGGPALPPFLNTCTTRRVIWPR